MDHIARRILGRFRLNNVSPREYIVQVCIYRAFTRALIIIFYKVIIIIFLYIYFLLREKKKIEKLFSSPFRPADYRCRRPRAAETTRYKKKKIVYYKIYSLLRVPLWTNYNTAYYYVIRYYQFLENYVGAAPTRIMSLEERLRAARTQLHVTVLQHCIHIIYLCIIIIIYNDRYSYQIGISFPRVDLHRNGKREKKKHKTNIHTHTHIIIRAFTRGLFQIRMI